MSDGKTGRQRYRVPMAAIVAAESAEQAYQVVSESLHARNRERPNHPMRIEIGPAGDVEGWQDEGDMP